VVTHSSIDIGPFEQAVSSRPERLRQQSEFQKVFGWFCTYTPIELIHAAGFLPARIYGGAMSIGQAGSLVPNFVCPYMRASLERALQGEYSYLSGVVQGYTCDVPCGMMSIWAENCGPGLFHTVPLPYNSSEDAREYLKHALHELIDKLNASGGDITDASIENSLDLYAKIRSSLLHLYELRRQGSIPFSAGDYYTIVEACFTMPPEIYLAMLAELLEVLRVNARPAISGIPVMISGSVIEQRLVYDLIEAAGGMIVADDLCSGYRFCMPPDGKGEDPLQRLIDRYVNHFPCPARSVVRDRIHLINELVNESGAKGMIFILQKFCTPHLADYPAMSSEMKSGRINTLLVELGESSNIEGQLKTRFEAFFEMIGG
jgi:benzoyl-CoA reductase/2-hydroxyglutaryl-CoA dehydratase subunit BcrC/BadD/HgdB